MTAEEYRKQYIAEMMEQANLSEQEATECFEALDDESLEEYVALGSPADDVATEISYWSD
jgi:hypothetical protein